MQIPCVREEKSAKRKLEEEKYTYPPRNVPKRAVISLLLDLDWNIWVV